MKNYGRAFAQINVDFNSARWAMFKLSAMGDYINSLREFDRIRKENGISKTFAQDGHSSQTQGLPKA